MPTLIVSQAVALIQRDQYDRDPGLGDVSFYSAELSIDGSPAGWLLGELRTVQVHDSSIGEVWERQGMATFRFNERDTIVVAGVVSYPVGTLHSPNERGFWRAVIGGTGAYSGTRGEVESVRAEGGFFTHTFTLL